MLWSGRSRVKARTLIDCQRRAETLSVLPLVLPQSKNSAHKGRRFLAYVFEKNGSPGKIRTCGQPVNSRLLYH